MKKLESLLLLAILLTSVLSIGYLASHAPQAKKGIEMHLMGK